jgi:pterin-4a-carbinolamine dehydratase
MPQALNVARLHDALSCLEEWSGDQHGITRTIEVPDWIHADLIERVKICTDALGHRAHITRAGERTRIWLCTESLGCVTDFDVTVAARIDAILRTAGAARAARAA